MNLKLQKWLQSNLPVIIEDLNGPASIKEIESVEEKVGVKFPVEFKELYLAYNGQKGEINTGPFYGLTFLTLDQMYDEWESWATIVDNDGENEFLSDLCSSHVKGAVKSDYANKKWVPFAYDGGGNFLGLDFDPSDRGTSGQVINFGADENVKYILGSSFSEFVDWYVDQLEKGNYRIDNSSDTGPSFNTKKPKTEHFLDSVKVLFK